VEQHVPSILNLAFVMASNGYVDFDAIKRKTSIEHVLTHYELIGSLHPKGEGKLVGPCPLCESDHETAFQADTELDFWYCFAHEEGGSVLDLVAQLQSVSIRDAGVELSQLPDAAADENERQREEATPDDLEPEPNEPLGFALKNLDPCHDSLAALNIAPETATDFGIGYCSKGMMEGRIAIPIRNSTGEIVAYTGRRVSDEEEPLYRYPPDFDRTQEVFNLHRLAAMPAEQTRCVYVLSDPMDALRLHQRHTPCVASFLGTTLSSLQASRLKDAAEGATKITVLKRSGHPALTASSVACLARSFYVKVIELPPR
jgi:DNA primase